MFICKMSHYDKLQFALLLIIFYKSGDQWNYAYTVMHFGHDTYSNFLLLPVLIHSKLWGNGPHLAANMCVFV